MDMMKKSWILMPLGFCLVVPFSYAKNADTALPDRVLQQNVAALHIQQDEIKQDAEKMVVLSNQDLMKQPELLSEWLQQALNGHQAELIESLADAYRQTPQADELLLERAKGTVLRLRGNIKQAMAVYQQLVQRYPDDVRIRLDLAAMQFENRQLLEATKQFTQIQETKDLPQAVYNNIDRFQQVIKQESDWQFEAGVSPVWNNNVNDAAPAYCLQGIYCSRERAEKAYGLAYAFSATKLTPFARGHALVFRSHADGTSYFLSKKSQYDTAWMRTRLGWQWQDYRHTWSVLPFYQAQLGGSSDFDHKEERTRRWLPYMYAHALGVEVAYTHRWTPYLQSHIALERYRRFHRENSRAERHDGFHDSANVSLAYQVSSDTALLGSYAYSRFVPKQERWQGNINNAAFQRHAIGAAWLQQWAGTKGLSTRLSVSYAHRNYKGKAMFSEFAQKNRETSVNLQITHNRLNIWGFQPVFNIVYGRIHSNQAWAERRHQQWFFTAQKRF